jgi:hypothetical protein
MQTCLGLRDSNRFGTSDESVTRQKEKAIIMPS